jgi:hypothetical protein
LGIIRLTEAFNAHKKDDGKNSKTCQETREASCKASSEEASGSCKETSTRQTGQSGAQAIQA